MSCCSCLWQYRCDRNLPLGVSHHWTRCLGCTSGIVPREAGRRLLQTGRHRWVPDDNFPGRGWGTRRSDTHRYTSPSIPRVHRGARVGPVVGSFPGRMDSSDGSPGRSRCCVGITARCQTHGFQFIGVESVCHVVTSYVYWSHAVGFRPWIFPFRRGQGNIPHLYIRLCLFGGTFCLNNKTLPLLPSLCSVIMGQCYRTIGTLGWTVIIVISPTVLGSGIFFYYVLYIHVCCRPGKGRPLVRHIIRDYPFDRWLFFPRFLFGMDRVHLVCVFGIHIILLFLGVYLLVSGGVGVPFSGA